MHASLLNQMEQEINQTLKSFFGKNLVSLLVEGSYGTYDIIEGYSDYDLCALVKDVSKTPDVDLGDLSKKYSIDIKCSVKSYKDFQNRVKNSNKSSRFIDNLWLVKAKKQARVLVGKNVLNQIPSIKELIKRDIGCELRADYYYATNLNPEWNIFRREPQKWVNYIINMSNDLLLSKGVITKKADIPAMLEKHCPEFKGVAYVKEALYLRKTKKVLHLTKIEKNQLKKTLGLFLEDYKLYTFGVK